MIPIRLEINDFLSYRGHHELDFSGIHVASIVGPNGSGKSALLDAISWVLFGRSREHSIVGRKTNRQRDSVINDSADSCEVSLEFEVEGSRFLVNRTIDRGKGGWRVQFKHLTSSGEENIKEKGKIDPIIEQELGVTYDVFFSSSFITQGDSSRFMGASVAKRLELLSDILDLSAYDRCLTETKRLAKETNEKQLLLESKADEWREKSSNIDELEDQLKNAVGTRKIMDKQLSELSEKIDSINRQSSNLNHALEEISIKKQRQRKLSAELKELMASADRINIDINDHKSIISNADAIEIGYKQYEQSRVNLDELNEKKVKHEDLRFAIDEISTKIRVEEGKLKSRLESLQSRADQLKGYIQQNSDASERLKDVTEKRNRLKEVQSRLDELISKTKETESRMESAKVTQKDLRQQLDQLLTDSQTSTAKDAMELLVYIEGNLPLDLQQAREKLDANKLAVANKQSELSSVTVDITHITEELKLLESKEGGQCPLCGSELSDDSAQELTLKKHDKLDELNSRLEVLKRESDDLLKLECSANDNVKQLELMLNKQASLKQINLLAKRINEAQSFSIKYDKELISLNKKYFDIDNDNKELLESSDKLDDDYINLSSISSALIEKRVELESVSAELEKAKDVINTNSFCVNQRNEVKALTEKLEKLGFDTAEYQKVSDDERRLRVYVESKNNLDLSKERLTSAEKELAGNKERQVKIETEISKIGETTEDEPLIKEKLENTRIQLKTLTDEKKEISSERDEAIRVVESKSSAVDSAREASKQLTEASTKLSQLEVESGMLDRLKVMFGREGIPSQILEGVVPQLEDVANDILERISKGRHHGEAMRMRFELTRESASGKSNTALDVILSDGDNERPYELFSGGERFRADFAIRLALSHILARRSGRRLRMLVIDEGFGTQDDEGVSALIDAIHDVSADFEKVLVVSHVDEIKNQFDRQISVWKDCEGSHFRLV
jgi:DNA repair protein SbcC/Rad50